MLVFETGIHSVALASLELIEVHLPLPLPQVQELIKGVHGRVLIHFISQPGRHDSRIAGSCNVLHLKISVLGLRLVELHYCAS